ncbi:MAG TPA: hypothetical protein PKV48_02015 [Thermodesulfobacteriota bacterium]|nr:hypothetical protein [Thermodesulfobacteriota bacterium]
MVRLKAKRLREDQDYIHLKIKKDDFEAFCSAAGLFKGSFVQTLKRSEKDLSEGRFTKRKSLGEIIDK